MSDTEVFNDLTDNLFGYLAQIGLRRTSRELGSDPGDIDYRKAYDGLIAFAREAHRDCEQIRERLLSPPQTNPIKKEKGYKDE